MKKAICYFLTFACVLLGLTTNSAFSQTAKKLYWSLQKWDGIYKSQSGIHRYDLINQDISNIYEVPDSTSILGIDVTSTRNYWIERYNVLKISDNQWNVIDSVHVKNGALSDIHVYEKRNTVYLTDFKSGKIYSTNLNGDYLNTIVDFDSSGTKENKSRGIKKNINKSFIKNPPKKSKRSQGQDTLHGPWGIHVDSLREKIYWTDQIKNAIYRADLDGSNIQIVIDSLYYPRGLALHLQRDEIYFVAGGSDIKRATIDGDSLEIIHSVCFLAGCNPLHLAVNQDENRIYWSDNVDDGITSSTLDGKDITHIESYYYDNFDDDEKGPVGLALTEKETKEGPAFVVKAIYPDELNVDHLEISGLEGSYQPIQNNTTAFPFSNRRSDRNAKLFKVPSEDIEKIATEDVAEDKFEVLLFESTDKLLGHIEMSFPKTIAESNNDKIHAALYVQNREPQDIDQWEYYGPNEHPVYMIIPPKHNLEQIDSVGSPLLMVHGLSSSYPTWGKNTHKIIKKDVWQFYYPYNQGIGKSSHLLDQAISEVLDPINFFGEDLYGSLTSLPIVAHSMGGLVTRHYIQSSAYDHDISKFLMLGTPNHGSLASFFLREKLDKIDLLGILENRKSGKDPEAPAYSQLYPGSRFLNRLNSTKPKKLSRDQTINQSYLVVAGTKDYIPIYTEAMGCLKDHDDGIVAVSSASLIDKNIPLATTRLAHTNNDFINLKILTKSLINGFLDSEYDSNSPSTTLPIGSSPGQVTAFYSTEDVKNTDPFTEDVSFDQNTSLIVLESNKKIRTEKLTTEIKNQRNQTFPAISKDGSGSFYSKFIKSTSESNDNLFYVLNRIAYALDISSFTEVRLPQLGFYAPNDEYQIRLGKRQGSDQVSFIYKSPFTPIKPLRTNKINIDLTSGELLAFNSSNYVTPESSKKNQLSENTNGKIKENIYVDSSVDSLDFIISPGEKDLTSYNLELINPDGQTITPSNAESNPDIEFKEDTDLGISYYFVRYPESGEWQISYSNELTNVEPIAALQSKIKHKFTIPDSVYMSGDKIPLLVKINKPTSTDLDSMIAKVFYDDTTHVDQEFVSKVKFSQSTAEYYTAAFTADSSGWYTFKATSYFNNSSGETVRRNSVKKVDVGSETMVSIDDGDKQIQKVPKEFILKQNYPNPFNPYTNIEFDLPKTTNVTLTIYNTLGQKITNLLNKKVTAGSHTVTFDGSELSSGLYIYRIKAGEFTESKTMMLLK